MIRSEGYKAFRGTMRIAPNDVPPYKATPYEVHGDWLYKPEYDCWYARGRSFPASVCEVVKDETA